MKCEWLIVLVINSVRAYLPGKIPNRGSDLSETISIDENEHMQLIQSIIDDDYNKKIKPHSDSQLNVSVNIFVDTMSDISESSMDYEMTIFFRQFWNGKRPTVEGNKIFVGDNVEMLVCDSSHWKSHQHNVTIISYAA